MADEYSSIPAKEIQKNRNGWMLSSVRRHRQKANWYNRMKTMKRFKSLALLLPNKFLENDTLIGFIAGNSKKMYTGLTFYLAEFCINNQIQGKGYGSKLLLYLEEELKKRDIQSIYLLTATGGLAEAFYLKNNYIVYENRVVMKKNL